MQVVIKAIDTKLNVSRAVYNYDLYGNMDAICDKIKDFFDIGYDKIEIEKAIK